MSEDERGVSIMPEMHCEHARILVLATSEVASDRFPSVCAYLGLSGPNLLDLVPLLSGRGGGLG